MQKSKLETFKCNTCAKTQGTVLLDCYCLFCLDCFQSTDIEKEYTEKAKYYQKGKSVEKCKRCKRNTEYKIYYLDKKSDSDHCRMLFWSLTGGFMAFYRVLEFQTLQKNREIQNLSANLQGVYKKLGTLLNENSHLSKYFDEKEIKNIKGFNKNVQLIETINVQNDAIQIDKTMTANAINNTAKAQKNEVNNDIPPLSAQKDNTEFIKTPHNNRITKHKERDKTPNANFTPYPSKPSERSAKQMGDNIQMKGRQGGQTAMGYEEVMNTSYNQRSNFNTGVDKGRGKGMDQRMLEEQPQQQMLYKKSLMKNQGYGYEYEYETPVVPQLKKAKITANPNQETNQNQKEELKKLFGFELKEIKKTSPRPSTEKPKGNENVKAPPQPQLRVQQQSKAQLYQNERNNYWGRGYHLNYPSYN